MCEKFNYDSHVFSIVARGDSQLQMTVRSLATGQTYFGQHVVLTKITKDTVYATLSKKDKCMECRFQYLDVQPRTLILSFVVRLEYLPQFQQSVTLLKVVDGQAMEKISALDIQNEVNELNRILDNLKLNGPLVLHDKNMGLTGKTEIDCLEVEMGVHVLQLTGILFSTSSVMEVMEVEVDIQDEGKPIVMHMKCNCMTSYGYPYSFIRQIEVKKKSNVKIAFRVTGGTNPNIANHLTTLIPVISA